MNTQEFMTKHGINMTSKPVEANPNMNDMPEGSTHWRCIFSLNASASAFGVYYSMGPALKGEPKADELLDCLASNAATYENARTFDDWCSEYGYDTDSRKAERIFKAVFKQAGQLKRFLGDDLYNDLLWNTDRD